MIITTSNYRNNLSKIVEIMRVKHNLNDVDYITEVINMVYTLKWFGATINSKPITNADVIAICYEAMAGEDGKTMTNLCKKYHKIMSKCGGEDIIYV